MYYITDCLIILIFRRISKDVVWSSIISHLLNPKLKLKDKKFKNKKSSKQTDMECFPLKTTEDTQCYYDKIVLNYEASPLNSIIIAIKLSPTVYRVRKNNNHIFLYILIDTLDVSKYQHFRFRRNNFFFFNKNIFIFF